MRFILTDEILLLLLALFIFILSVTIFISGIYALDSERVSLKIKKIIWRTVPLVEVLFIGILISFLKD